MNETELVEFVSTMQRAGWVRRSSGVRVIKIYWTHDNDGHTVRVSDKSARSIWEKHGVTPVLTPF